MIYFSLRINAIVVFIIQMNMEKSMDHMHFVYIYSKLLVFELPLQHRYMID
jgi:hypothetical protein